MDENIAPDLGDQNAESNQDDISTAGIWLLDESEGISTKIEEYINKVADTCIAEEQSLFLLSTLQRAQETVRHDQANGLANLQSQSGRSSYNLQNELLKDTVELWVETAILALRTPAEVEIRYNPREAPSSQVVTTHWTGQQSDHYVSLPPRSRELILAQIRGATEWRCHGLAKTIMNEMERRLLQRAQVSRFATVMSAVILLSCIERMTGAYRLFDPDRSPTRTRRGHATDAGDENTDLLVENTQFRPPDWPLDTPPRKLWLQGERFADLLIMLLRTRNLPPRTTTTAEGRLVVSLDNSQVMTISRSVKDQTNDQTKLPASWLNPIGLKESDLIRTRDDRLPNGNQGVRDWDMKFISRLLLSESTK